MTIRSLSTLAVALLATACASKDPALRRTYDPNTSPTVCLLSGFSRSSDGSVTKADVKRGIEAGFAAADANHDGVLDFEEVGALNTANASSCDQTSWIIRDPSGMRIEQYGARYLTAYEDADINVDGVATREEIVSARRRPPKAKRKPAEEQQQAPEPTQSPMGNPGGY